MTSTFQTLFSEPFLRSVFDNEFQQFRNSEKENNLLTRLTNWSTKDFQKEISAEIAFVNIFFEDIWGYTQSGKIKGAGYICYPKGTVLLLRA